jgi:amylosucrase
MVQLWSMLAAQDVTLATQALRALPPVPTSTAWITYVRCHDDIGWAVSDADAAAVGISGPEHRRFLSDWYSGTFPGSTARGLVFQENPATGDRRISGSAAALVGLTAARQGSDDAAVDAAVDRLLLAHTLVMGWGGIPVVWMGDELALDGDPGWDAVPEQAADNRWVHRPWFDDDALRDAADPSTVPGRVLAGFRHLARVRASLPHLHAAVPAEVLDLSDPGILAVLHRHPEGNLLTLCNVTATWRSWPGFRLEGLGLTQARDALTDGPVPRGEDGNVWLAPWQALWLVAPDA